MDEITPKFSVVPPREEQAPQVAPSDAPILRYPGAEYEAPQVIETGGLQFLYPRKTFSIKCWTILVAAVLILVSGVSAGLVVYFSNRGNDRNVGAMTASTSPTISTLATTAFPSWTRTSAIHSSTPSKTNEPVSTHSSDGTIANLSCKIPSPQGTNYTTHWSPTTFIEQCYTDYIEAWNNTSTHPVPLVDRLAVLTYTFEDCMEQCAIWNFDPDNASRLCRAVTYNANLSSVVEANAGNCFLKSAKGKKFDEQSDWLNYALVASAWVSGGDAV